MKNPILCVGDKLSVIFPNGKLHHGTVDSVLNRGCLVTLARPNYTRPVVLTHRFTIVSINDKAIA